MDSTTSTLEEMLQAAFTPTERAVLGLVDNLLEACPPTGLCLVWSDDRCRVSDGIDRNSIVFEAVIRRSVFRAALARIAKLCNETKPNSVSPYGGDGEISTNSGAAFAASFVNTPAEQRLELSRIS